MFIVFIENFFIIWKRYSLSGVFMKRCIFLITAMLIMSMFYSSLFGYIIDSMDYAGTLLRDSNAGITISGVPGKVGNCLEIDYDFSIGDYLKIYYKFSYEDFQVGDQLCFYMKGLGANNTLEVWLTDTDGNSINKDLLHSTLQPNWIEKKISLSDFSGVNLSRVKNLKFSISSKAGDQAGTGSVYIDQPFIYQSQNTSAEFTNVDDFEDSTEGTNLLGGENSSYFNGPTSTIQAVNPGNNYGTLKFTKGEGTGFGGWIVNLENLDISAYDSLRFKIWGNEGGEKIAIGLQNSDNKSGYVNVDNYLTSGNITTSEQWCSIPLNHFNLQNLSSMGELKIVFQDDNVTGYGSILGTENIDIMLDDIKFYTGAKTKGVKKVIDQLDIRPALSPWDKGDDSTSEISLSLVPGYNNKAYKIEYNLGTGVGQYVYLHRDFGLNLFEGGGISFYVRGKDNNSNLEVQIKDTDGTMYWRKFYGFTDTGNQWRKVGIEFDDLAYQQWGSDGNLNLKKVEIIAFAISKYEDASKGTVAFDEIEAVDPNDFEIDSQKYKIFNSVEIPDVIFSPNNDDYKDEFKITFSLKKKAKISFKIYDLAGLVIKDFPEHEYQSYTDYSLAWKGEDFSKDIVRNGVFLFQIKAVSFEGDTERVNHGLVVIK